MATPPVWWAIIRRRKIRSASTPVAAFSSASCAGVAMPGIEPSGPVCAAACSPPTQAIGGREPVWSRPHCTSHPYICPACCCWLVMMS